MHPMMFESYSQMHQAPKYALGEKFPENPVIVCGTLLRDFPVMFLQITSMQALFIQPGNMMRTM
jgi:hypothetical protein